MATTVISYCADESHNGPGLGCAQCTHEHQNERLLELEEALVDARLLIQDLADQQGIRDDWWVSRDQELRRILGRG